jgi:2-polyprenyl-3-methyl-5-hydroxy-6-metoxy-1,4-benzoquinol methylase
MLKQEIESESRQIMEFFDKFWPLYVNINFDKTFSLRNWTTIMAAIVLHYNKKISNNKINNYEKLLGKIFSNKKILHIGCGYGYFLEVVKSLKGIPYGIEPYCSFPSNLGIFKAKIEDLQDNDSELTKKLTGRKFDIIVAHDLFVSSIIINQDNVNKIILSLREYLENNGMMIFESQNEEALLDENDIGKFGFDVEDVEDISNPYGEICSQFLIVK